MVGASKILTVSYGTFSCTLEGFDEPFSTMKAIAEYFRDLAADDRYFGAEPPTPDADMLHRIAEREIQRRVEAKVGKDGVTLRPQEAAELAAPPAPVEPAAAAVAAVPEIAVPEEADSVAAKLQRIRAAVASARATAQPYIEDEPVDTFPGETTGVTEDFGFELDLSGPLLSEEDPAEAMAVAAPEEAPAEVEAEVVAPEVEAAKPQPGPARLPEETLARRRAQRRAARAAALAAAAVLPVEEAGAAPSDPAPGETAADIPEDVTVAEAPEELVALAEAEPIDEIAVPEEAVAAARSEAGLVEAVADADADADAEIQAEAEAEVEAEAEIQAESEAEAEAPSQEEAVVEAEMAGEAAPEPAPTGAQVAPMHDDIPVEAAEPPEAEVDAFLASLIETEDPVAETAPAADDEPELAAVLAALAPEAAEAEAGAQQPPAPADELDTLLATLDTEDPELAEAERISAELDLAADATEDAELQALLTGDEALSGDDQRDIAAAVAEVAQPGEPAAEDAAAPPVADHPVAHTPEDGVLSRLLKETNTKLEGSENRRRFSAIAHLKAAVAATVADRLMRGGSDARAKPADETEAYRDDLTQAVRPRRPVASGEATSRPAVPEMRPAPLVLVSEQRIDRQPGTGPAGPQVRPRRISAAQIAARQDADDTAQPPASEATSFADFAETLGTSGLAELLEAAAAYTATVEGRPHFSPPQIMKKVAAMSDDGHYTREDGLRSFGQLLRQGKIAKVRRGQYQITEQSRFWDETRRAAN